LRWPSWGWWDPREKRHVSPGRLVWIITVEMKFRRPLRHGGDVRCRIKSSRNQIVAAPAPREGLQPGALLVGVMLA
jgi:hypothetical protein